MLRYIFLISTLFVLTQSASYLLLDGNDWTVVNSNKSIRVSANVPGSIYTDLVRNRFLQQDPYYGYNDINYRWVSYDNWTYSKTFNVNENILNHNGVYLVCHGLDTVSQIYINNVLIGTTNNMFIRYKFDVKSVLKVGTNNISVAFQSAVTYAKQKRNEQVTKRNYIVPPECPVLEQKGECHPNYIRKMQASFSWDWGPAFPTQGIWKPISLEAFDSAVIRDLAVETIFNNDSSWTMKTKIFMEATSTAPIKGTFQFYLDDKILLIYNLNAIPNPDNSVETRVNLSVKSITPWWPNGVGFNIQKLYKFKVIFIPENMKEHSTKQINIGFRTIELVQTPIKPAGLTFYFKVNGLPFFAKGSNWIPAHVFTELLNENYLRHLLKSAKEANMNMLRVWGGGIYETEEFYRIADEYGIMIWQDLMFACALYPTDNLFLKSVDVEVTQNVRRLQHHPSIALWAGNNENEAGIATFWWPEVLKKRALYKQDYITLYVNVTRTIVLAEDSSRQYVASSPSNGLETEREGWIAKNPFDERFGDIHHYDYGSTPWNWKIYPSPKFTSEFGFESYPTLNTLATVSQPSDWTYPISKLMDFRNHHPHGKSEIENMIKTYMKLPAPGSQDRFADLIYLSQIVQAMAMKTETEFYRRNRQIDSNTGKGFTMGALYWQLNDIWQGPTWATLEFGGKWKMGHYYAKKMFDNLLVSPYEDDGQVLKVSVVRDDYFGLIPFNLTIKVFKWSSLSPVNVKTMVVLTNESTATMVHQESIPSLLQTANCGSRNECLIKVEIENQGLRAENFVLLEPLKNAIGLVNPQIKVVNITKLANFNDAEPVFVIKLGSSSIAPFVWLDFRFNSTVSGTFSDNGFVMVDKEVNIQFKANQPANEQTIIENLTIKSLTDVVSS